MPDSFIQIPPDDTGKKIDTAAVDFDGDTRQRQRVQISGAATDQVAAVLADTPASDAPALIVRPILTDALAPIEVKLDIIINILAEIRDNTAPPI